ncbi:MAG: DUF1295 domain-containing protein [Actinomycetota bacterium]|nr:DUF1295 domain-containing protein [Actinomycetota bacterium]MED5292418.1 DUF1295 domain-containing protein [Actinomycetota bacterium]
MSRKTSILGIVFGLGAASVFVFGAVGRTWSDGQQPTLLIAAGIAFVLQWIAFAFAWRRQSERFFDLIGSATFISVALISVVMSTPSIGALDVALACAVIVWASRLGTFLSSRVRAVGSDNRFKAMKRDFFWFLMTWTLQGTWVVVTASAAMTVIGDQHAQPLGVVEILGLLIWATGLLIEVIADQQKKEFRLAGNTSFISSGLWSRSRHPNYFGEILLWSGIALAAAPSLHGWQHITLLSPVFVWLLLMKISGAPMLEAKADRRWGHEPAYNEYKKTTPLLLPRLW